jgi:hypothetical protein
LPSQRLFDGYTYAFPGFLHLRGECVEHACLSASSGYRWHDSHKLDRLRLKVTGWKRLLLIFSFAFAAFFIVSRDENCNENMQEVDGFRFVGARALVSSHANGETSENQNRAGRKAPARASPEFTA